VNVTSPPEIVREGFDVLQVGEEHADAARIVVADMQHLGKTTVLGEIGGKVMLVGHRVEPRTRVRVRSAPPRRSNAVVIGARLLSAYFGLQVPGAWCGKR
jgi:hypothetical protein